MALNTRKNLSKRIAELEKSIVFVGAQVIPGLFDEAVLKWGPVPVDLLEVTEAIPARSPEAPFVAVECLDVCNRAARWISTGNQWGDMK